MSVIDQEISDRYAIYNADCMEVLPTLQAGSVDLSVYSPPFPELYQYSNDPRDMSNCTSYEESLEQYRFVVKEIARVTKRGRMSCVHCTDLKRGMFQRDFPGDIVRIHEEAGMHFFCRITIWKDPWHFARRTRMLTLRHKQLVEDSSLCRIAPPDYLLVFRHPGDNAVPITHHNGMNFYVGETPMPPELVKKYGSYHGDQRANLLSHWIWRQYASPVWMDIRRKRLLPFRDAKESPEEKHVCPLQLDVIERCLILWSNPGEVVLTPFMGIGSEVYSAIVNQRRGIGVELKPSYYRQAARMLNVAATSGREACEEDVPDEPEDGTDAANGGSDEDGDSDGPGDGGDMPACEPSQPGEGQSGGGQAAVGDAAAVSADSDELSERAWQIVVRHGRISISLIQRQLNVCFGRALRIVQGWARSGRKLPAGPANQLTS